MINNSSKETKLDWTKLHKDFNEYQQQKWEQVNITYSEVQTWITLGFGPYELYLVKQWKNLGFSPIEVKEWLSKGLDKNEAHLASWLRNNNQVIADNLEQLRKDYQNLQETNLQAWLEQVYANQQIKEIDISNKNLKGELNLSNYSQLEKLDCSSNNLTNIIYPEQLEYLTKLNISSNNFNQEPTFLTQMPQLAELDISYNHFTNLESYLKYCPQLRILNAWNNKLSGKLNISDLVYLTEIYLGYNNLTNLALLNLPSLTGIYLYNNKLTKLDFLTTLSNTEKLTNLDVSSNRFLNQTLDCFTILVSLEYLNLEETKFFGFLAPLTNCQQLKKLRINNTKLNSDLECLPSSLETITTDDDSELAQKLEGFKFKNEFRSKYNYQAWRSCLEWAKGNNELTTEQKQSITVLNLSQQNLTDYLDFSDFTNLEELYCSHNNLTHLNLSQNFKLKVLIANDNQLADILLPTDAEQLILERVDIANNDNLNYSLIESRFSKPLPVLTENKIRAIDKTEFEQLIRNKANIKGTIENIHFFSTWWNPNCALVVNKVVWRAIHLVIYEPLPLNEELEKEKRNREEELALAQQEQNKKQIKYYKSQINFLLKNKLFKVIKISEHIYQAKINAKIAELKEQLNSDHPILALYSDKFNPTEVIQITKLLKKVKDNPDLYLK